MRPATQPKTKSQVKRTALTAKRQAAELCISCGRNPSPVGEQCQGCSDYNRTRHATQRMTVLTRLHTLTNTVGGVSLSCLCCGHSDERVLTVQHLAMDGATHRKSIGGGGLLIREWIVKQSDDTLQAAKLAVWCANCQLIERVLGSCIHHDPQAERRWFHAPTRRIDIRESIHILHEQLSHGKHCCQTCWWSESPYGLVVAHVGNERAAIANASGQRKSSGTPLARTIVATFRKTGVWNTSGLRLLCANCNEIEAKETQRAHAATRALLKAQGLDARRRPSTTFTHAVIQTKNSHGNRRRSINGFEKYASKTIDLMKCKK